MAIVEVLQNTIENLLQNPALVGVALCVCTLVLVLSGFLSSAKPGPNPFSQDRRRPPEKLELNQTVRDKVLKQGFNVKKIPEKLDAIVIGSGIGGLTTAALLSQAGKKVLVLEQHDQAGGCCHTYIEKGFEFDVGIHYVGKLYENSISSTILGQMTRGQLQWVRLVDNYDTVVIGEDEKRKYYPIPSGEKQYRDALVEYFPAEEQTIDKYLTLMNKVDKLFIGGYYLKFLPRWLSILLMKTGLIHLVTRHYTYSRKSVTQVLDELTDNRELKTVLAYNFGDYGTTPKEASFTMHVALTKHFMKGGYYPRGGASEIAYHIIPTIEETGGSVMVRAPVSEILVQNGKACGVRVNKSSGDVDIHAPLIISAAGVINTFTTLLPKHVAAKSKISELLAQKRIKSGVAGLSVFVGLDASKEELGLEAKNMWAFTSDNLDQALEDYLALSVEDAAHTDVPLMFVSFPSTKDPTWDDRYPGKTTLAIITLTPWTWFNAWEEERVMKRGEDYDGLKNAFGQRMFEQVCGMFPQISDKKVYMEVGSPVTNQYYLGASHGGFYGLDHDVSRFGSPEVSMALRPDTEIPGLYLTGQDIASCGFSGALFGGVITASVLLNRHLLNDALALNKQMRSKNAEKKAQ